MVAAGLLLVTGSLVAATLLVRAGVAGPLRLSQTSVAPASPQPAPHASNLPKRPLNLAFVGDIMAHEVNLTHPPYPAIYSRIESTIQQADLAFANLEFTIDPNLPLAGYPAFNVHPEYVEAAVDAGFRVFSVANNHIYDYGSAGIAATIAALDGLQESDGIIYSGIRSTGTDPMEPVTIERDGWRIGFLAITEFVNGYLKPDQVNLVNFQDPVVRSSFLDRLKTMTKGYDLFILSVHGGVQYALQPNPVKAAFFREAVKAGVTILWGQHPHVLQPWEIDTVDGTNRLIINSNGNFISGQISEIDPTAPSLPRTYTGDSAIFHVQVSRQSGKTSVVSVYPELVSNIKTADGEMIIEPLDQLVREELSPVWHDYYAYRLKTIRALTRGTVVALDGSSLPAIGGSDFAAWSAAPAQ